MLSLGLQHVAGGGTHSPRGRAKIRARQYASEPLACLGERDDLTIVSNFREAATGAIGSGVGNQLDNLDFGALFETDS